MPRTSKSLHFAADALRVVVEAIASIEDSPEKERILDAARTCEEGLKSWRETPPTKEQRATMLDRILKLHIAVAKLRRKGPAGT